LIKNELAQYVFWGIMATIINIVAFYVFTEFIGIRYIVSNIVAWILTVTFAFFTNKYLVFIDKDTAKEIIVSKYFIFLASRIITGVLDMGFMFLLVTIMVLDEMYSKILVSAFIIILNYFISKYLVFYKGKQLRF
jgi:putative flippase GtrA